MSGTYTAFLSYRGASAARVAEVYFFLKRTTTGAYFFYPERNDMGLFPDHLTAGLIASKHLVLFVERTSDSSEWQQHECNYFLERSGTNSFIPVLMDGVTLPSWAKKLAMVQHLRWNEGEGSAHALAKDLAAKLGLQSHDLDDLPTDLDARYEKQIVDKYRTQSGLAPAPLIEKGYPPRWPEVPCYPEQEGHALPQLPRIDSPLDPVFYGAPRLADALISVDARIRRANGSTGGQPLAFPEAGPRARVRRQRALKVGVLVSGGIAPGINAVISGIVERHEAYDSAFNTPTAQRQDTKIDRIEGGFLGLTGRQPPTRHIEPDEARKAVSEGGSILTTARADALLPSPDFKERKQLAEMAGRLHHSGYDILYVIGGEGSMRGAHALWTVYRSLYSDDTLSIIGVPKAMDNDILWVWQSFGFMSAVEKAREVIIQLHTEVRSNPRLAIVQLFGSSSGYVVSHAALGSNACDLALIPEMRFTMDDVCNYLENEVLIPRDAKGPPWGMVVMAETAIPEDFKKYRDLPEIGLTQAEKDALDSFKRDGVWGQTPDALRSAGLKIVCGVVQSYISRNMGSQRVGTHVDWRHFRVLANEPRHIIRSTPPSVTDVAFGIRLGTMAVDTAMAGYSDCMVSQWLTEYVAVPLKLVVLGRKLVPTDGIFWKTVVSKTGQRRAPGLCK